jgi:cell filamentation protein
MSGGKNCYPESDVLINKYNIRDKELLEKFEIQKVFAKLLGLDVRPERVDYTYDTKHLVSIHKYLFGDIYEWAGTFRKENLYKSERVLSGGSAEYADYREVEKFLKDLFQKYRKIDWEKLTRKGDVVSDFLLELWSIHPFREGNTRTCITFLWHYLKGKGCDFQVALLRNNPMYVRDSLVMANYDQKEYLRRIISDALQAEEEKTEYTMSEEKVGEQYQIAKVDYEAFRDKYSIKKPE